MAQRPPFEPYELFVRWYLRFNGYFTIENFVIHEPAEGGIPQGGETDLLAVRFPHSRENPGFDIEDDRRLIDQEAVAAGLIDFLIAEVKSAAEAVSTLWRPPLTDSKLSRAQYIIRRLGFCRSEEEIERVARQLQTTRRVKHDGVLLRVVYFGPKPNKMASDLGIAQLTHQDIATFLVQTRAGCWVNQGIGVRSAHDQWHPLIKEVWTIAGSDTAPDERIDGVLALLRDVKASA